MGSANYEYGTNPRKLEPNEKKAKVEKKAKIKVVKDVPRQEIKLSKEEKKKQFRVTITIIAIFALLLTISYRNSQINEKFSSVQSLKKELSALEKENEQLEVNIENGLNLNNIEKMAKEKLGMQKLTNKQTKYISLPKKDYTEPASEQVIIEEEKSWIDSLMELLGIK